MKQTLLSLLAVFALATSFARAQVIDDFSGDGWRLFSSTPGEIIDRTGKDATGGRSG